MLAHKKAKYQYKLYKLTGGAPLSQLAAGIAAVGAASATAPPTTDAALYDPNAHIHFDGPRYPPDLDDDEKEQGGISMSPFWGLQKEQKEKEQEENVEYSTGKVPDDYKPPIKPAAPRDE